MSYLESSNAPKKEILQQIQSFPACLSPGTNFSWTIHWTKQQSVQGTVSIWLWVNKDHITHPAARERNPNFLRLTFKFQLRVECMDIATNSSLQYDFFQYCCQWITVFPRNPFCSSGSWPCLSRGCQACAEPCQNGLATNIWRAA